MHASDVNYQVQEKHTDGSWRWYSDFRTYEEARNMKEVYKKLVPNKQFRIVTQPQGLG